VVGKPSRYMVDAILRLLGLPAEACIMTGDRLETDVAMGVGAGMATALTLTGATQASAVATSPIQPTYVIHRLSDLLC
jgi:arabinose operon protein AraL